MIVTGVAGVPGLTITAKLFDALVPHELVADTVMFPFCPALPVVTVIEFDVPPAVMLHPVGTVQLYDVALATAVIEYVCPVRPGHCGVVPVIVPGVAGVPGLTVTAKLFDALVPHELVAVTVMFPFCPALPAVTVIEFDVEPDVMLHPVGTVQL